MITKDARIGDDFAGYVAVIERDLLDRGLWGSKNRRRDECKATQCVSSQALRLPQIPGDWDATETPPPPGGGFDDLGGRWVPG
ncbi:hypothetical protein QR685DRAFT_504260 [Neurospora intermedia]|uniref:Uncharacterized protein n=1 Tax=Neurospora intermedia TaxID=5142 RepID=A0ABR3D329_NEUIN